MSSPTETSAPPVERGELERLFDAARAGSGVEPLPADLVPIAESLLELWRRGKRVFHDIEQDFFWCGAVLCALEATDPRAGAIARERHEPRSGSETGEEKSATQARPHRMASPPDLAFRQRRQQVAHPAKDERAAEVDAIVRLEMETYGIDEDTARTLMYLRPQGRAQGARLPSPGGRLAFPRCRHSRRVATSPIS